MPGGVGGQRVKPLPTRLALIGYPSISSYGSGLLIWHLDGVFVLYVLLIFINRLYLRGILLYKSYLRAFETNPVLAYRSKSFFSKSGRFIRFKSLMI